MRQITYGWLLLAALACLPAQWAWSRWREPPTGGLYSLYTHPSGAAVELAWVDARGTRTLPLGRTPRINAPPRFPASVRLRLAGYRDRDLVLPRPRSLPARHPETGAEGLEPLYPGVGLLYAARDWPFLFLAAGLAGAAAWGLRREGRRAGEAERLRRLFDLGEVLEGVEVGGYVLGPRIGRGGMAAVYRATRAGDPAGEVLALKLMDPALSRDESYRQRFLREVDVGRRLSHPNAMALLDWGEVAGRLYLVMEFVEGETLSERLARGPAPVEEAARWGRQAAEALACAHGMGVIHRDVKPSNLMLARPRGTLKVMDFGIARRLREERLTEAGGLMGSPGYVAPEAIAGGEADERVDLYSLGAVLYEALAGRCAYAGDTAVEVLTRQAREDPRPLRDLRPDVPPGLADLVHRLMARDPAGRGEARTAAEALRRWEARGPAGGPEGPPP